MTYQNMIEEIKKCFENADVSRVQEHIAYQFNISGEAGGAFYAEINDGRLSIEPYEYYDRDVLITTTAETLLAAAEGKISAADAVSQGKLQAEGDFAKVTLLFSFCGQKKAADASDEKQEEAAPVKEEKEEEKEAEEKPVTAAKTKTAKTRTAKTSKAASTTKAAKTEKPAKTTKTTKTTGKKTTK